MAGNLISHSPPLEVTLNVPEVTCVIHDLYIRGTGSNSTDCPEVKQEFEYYLAAKVGGGRFYTFQAFQTMKRYRNSEN